MVETAKNTDIQTLFEAGAHYGYTRSRRHPSAVSYIFGTKERSDIFDLEKTSTLLAEAEAFVQKLAEQGKEILFVGGKHEAAAIVRDAAERVNAPYVAGRWIGGTLTNFTEIKKRLARLDLLRTERDRGERDKYTKFERLRMDREIEELEQRFGGISAMQNLPAALFVVDSGHESMAVDEARQMNIPVVGLANSDCDFEPLTYPVPANDTSVTSIRHIVQAISSAYGKNKKSAPAVSDESARTEH